MTYNEFPDLWWSYWPVVKILTYISEMVKINLWWKYRYMVKIVTYGDRKQSNVDLVKTQFYDQNTVHQWPVVKILIFGENNKLSYDKKINQWWKYCKIPIKIGKHSSKLTLKWIQKILKKNNTELLERSNEPP